MALTANLVWGLSIFPYKWLTHVPVLELNAHRFVWSGLAVGLLLWFSGRLGEVRAAVANRHLRAILPLSALLLGANATIYVIGIASNRVLEVSFGYFMSPLLLVGIGALLLGERLNGAQRLALALSVAACGVMAFGLDQIPWLGFAAAATWAAYAFIRKRTPVAAVPAFFLECALLMGPSLLLIVMLETRGAGHFLVAPATSALIVGTLFVTALPLVLFAAANLRLRLATMGQMQYIAPSIQFLIAILIYHEPADAARLTSFALIWLALAVFTLDMIRRERTSDSKSEIV